MDNNKAEGIIWVDQGVLITPANPHDKSDRLNADVVKTLSEFSDKSMAIIVRDGPDYTPGDERVSSLTQHFDLAIYFESDFQKTAIDSALTLAFLTARYDMGTKPQSTIAVISEAVDARHARNAGLAVLGYAENKEDEIDVKEAMSRVGAFKTVYTPQDIAPAVEDFRSFREYKFVPMAQGLK